MSYSSINFLIILEQKWCKYRESSLRQLKRQTSILNVPNYLLYVYILSGKNLWCQYYDSCLSGQHLFRGNDLVDKTGDYILLFFFVLIYNNVNNKFFASLFNVHLPNHSSALSIISSISQKKATEIFAFSHVLYVGGEIALLIVKSV